MTETNQKELTTLGGGCFWCLEPVFEALRGVEKVEPGYSGGRLTNPTYADVCTGSTGHAEVVQVTFNPEEISLRELLEVFFSVHDPTTPNRQGGDVGPQYRSVIFHHSPEQKNTAEEVIAALDKAGLWRAPIVTELAPFTAFYPAETYHHDYYERNPNQPYCRTVISPKLAKFRRHFAPKLS